jgi:hypothetical protein
MNCFDCICSMPTPPPNNLLIQTMKPGIPCLPSFFPVAGGSAVKTEGEVESGRKGGRN